MAYESMEIMEIFDTYEEKLDKTLTSLKNEYLNIRAGRANPRVLDKVVVDYYGQPTPINQVGNITVPEARMLVVSAWDVNMLKNIEKAIIAANIGINPQNDGKVIRLIFPELTGDKRKELAKNIKAMAENAKVALRNARRDINDVLKKMKKDSAITEDDLATYEKDVDKKLNEKIDAVDKLQKDKESEVTSI
ncbi:MAG: ribosome recycling factor [Clostridia bacterium]|jgi:ribosome recycling factor|nr:ribosome recycling factor [Clostridia bacterium]